jgi:haloacetate dehalogenase
MGYWHWAVLAQAAPLPERLILGDPDGFWIAVERMGMKRDERYPAEVVGAYRAHLTDPEAVTAMCEDYRAGATIDREHDDADRGQRTIACSVRVLWAANGALPRFYADPLELWRAYAPGVTGRAVDGASHFVVEDAPAGVAADLIGFFG